MLRQPHEIEPPASRPLWVDALWAERGRGRGEAGLGGCQDGGLEGEAVVMAAGVFGEARLVED